MVERKTEVTKIEIWPTNGNAVITVESAVFEDGQMLTARERQEFIFEAGAVIPNTVTHYKDKDRPVNIRKVQAVVNRFREMTNDAGGS